MIMYRFVALTLFFLPSWLVSAQDCTTELDATVSCAIANGFDLSSVNEAACDACNSNFLESMLGSASSCADIQSLLCANVMDCADECGIPAECTDEQGAYHLCLVETLPENPGCDFTMCSGGPGRFTAGIAAVISVMLIGALAI